MAKKTLGYEELQWTCPNCDGINPGSGQTCANCGAPQPDDVKFEQAVRSELLEEEAAIARAKAGPDIHCPYCGTRNLGNAEICTQCGGDLSSGAQRASGNVLGAFKTGPVQQIPCPNCGAENPDTAQTCAQCGVQMQLPKPEKPKAAAPPTPEPKKKGLSVVLFLIFAVVCCVAIGLLYLLFFRSETVNGTVSAVGWARTIEIEGLVPVEYSNWDDQIPAEAEVSGCQDEVRSIESEPQPGAEEVCGTPYSVDTGGGYAEVVQDCEYHVYDEYCTYSVIEWAVVDTASVSGDDFYPAWPEPALGADERLGARTEQYQVIFDADRETYTYNPQSLADWQQFEIGSPWNLEVNALGGVLSVSP